MCGSVYPYLIDRSRWLSQCLINFKGILIILMKVTLLAFIYGPDSATFSFNSSMKDRMLEWSDARRVQTQRPPCPKSAILAYGHTWYVIFLILLNIFILKKTVILIDSNPLFYIITQVAETITSIYFGKLKKVFRV